MGRTIAVNTRLLLPGKLEGIGWFTYETLQRMTRDHPEVQFHFLFDRPFDERFVFNSNVTPHVVPPQARHPLLFYAWFEWQLSSTFNTLKPDLFLSPDGYGSLRSQVKQLLVIHDINFEHYPEHLPWAARTYLRYYFPRFAQKATRIATVSEFSKKDITERYRIDPGKIDVVYNGASAAFQPLPSTDQEIARKRFAQGKPYFIYVGALQPRKNIPNLLRAFDRFKSEHGTDHQLVLAGARKWWGTEQESVVQEMKHADALHFTGRLEQEDLALALGGASAMTYVSVFEGFGIPLLEAMKSDVPILTSNVSSLPEIAADAALCVDPHDTEAIANGLYRLVHEPGLPKQLIQAGQGRQQAFSWDKTAALLWESIERTWQG